MLQFFSQVSDVEVFLILSITLITLSLVSILIVKKYIPAHLCYKHNTVIGYTSSLVGVIYGVLVGLTALYLFNINTYAVDAVQQEANAVANIYRDSRWLDEPSRSLIQAKLKKYMVETITIEWPLMRIGERINHDGDIIIDDIMADLVRYKVPEQSNLSNEMMHELNTMYDARHQRIHMSYSELSPEIWVVILIGSFLTVIINFFYGTDFYFHMLIVIAVAVMASSMVFLLLTLNRPFQGEFTVEPHAMEELLEYVSASNPLLLKADVSS